MRRFIPPHSRSLFRFPRFLSLVILAAAAFVFLLPSAASAQNTVNLPIEVYPSDGRSTHSESVTVNASNGSAADRIYFQMHQPFYHKGGWQTDASDGFDPERMVDVRLNGGSWTTVRDGNVNCARPESEFGCVAGAWSTIRFSMSASELGGAVDGANTLEFRFNGTEGVRSGFRVLHVGFMRSSDNVQSFVPLPKSGATESLIDGTVFEYWDPDQWTAPSGYGDSQSVSEGEAIWRSENNLRDIDGSSIVAGCASCHATDGRDLQYFAYSNETIVARSQAHGLSETDGKKIAAYIRSLSFTHGDGSPTETNSPGTPWDPPYQPGPTGFGPDGNQHPDEAEPFYWAAGAGVDWVLDSELATLPHIFPASGDPANPAGLGLNREGKLHWTRYKITNGSEWATGRDRGTAVNMREIPLAAQFPDWNNWLPDVHPHDGLEKLFDGSETESHFDNGESVFQSGSLDQKRDWAASTGGIYQRDIKSVVKNEIDDPSLGTNNSLSNNQWVHAINGGVQWRAVKTWYLQHKYDVEDKADDLYCDGSATEWCEPLGWLGDARTVFDMAPHVSGTNYNKDPYAYGSLARSTWYSHIWYQVQMVVNPGTEGNTGQIPVDEGYQESFMRGGSKEYDTGAGIRQLMSEWKFFQMRSNPIDDRKGMTPGAVKLKAVLNVVRTGNRKNAIWDETYSSSGEKENISLAIEAFLRAVNTYMVGEDGSEGRIATLDRLSGSDYDKQGFTWNGIGYDPEYTQLPKNKDYVSQIYNVLSGNMADQDEPLADFFPNMSRGTIDSLAAQGDLLAPDDRDDGYAGEVTNGWSLSQGRWHDFVDYTYTPPETVLQGLSLSTGWNLISSHVAPENTDIDAVFSEISSDVDLVKNGAGEVYSPPLSIDQIGNWNPDEAYAVYMAASQSLDIEGQELSSGRTIYLQEGWNMLPFYPTTEMDVVEAMAAIESKIVMLKDWQGNSYVPDPDMTINEIGTLKPGQGYKIYMSEAVSFSYPTP